MDKTFLPVSRKDMESRGWEELDIILVTGDAYCDHPSYGAAIIGRVLEDSGYRVGIIAQPDWRRTDDFKKLGKPRLFFGITAGNLDSMVANYTANRNRRRRDEYSPAGKPGLRPDRASIIYANRVREAFPEVPVVIGGLEASLRRLAHYDYWSDKVRRSLLMDSKADILVYGMGENQILEIAKHLSGGEGVRELDNIRGTVVSRKAITDLKNYVEIPSFEEVSADTNAFNKAFRIFYSEFDPLRGRTIVQKHGDRHIVQFPPAAPLTEEEMDRIYLLDYARAWHPIYDKDGGVPGFETIRFSIVSHRGCPGECSFCALYLHQGRIVQSRCSGSIIEEARRLAERKDFKGTITDIGGPTANLYMARCKSWHIKGACKPRKCIFPTKCVDLELGYTETLKLWDKIKTIPKVKHIFIGSGVRYDLLVDNYSNEYLKTLCLEHVSGQLKVAPEHSERRVLELMNKPPFEIYEKFADRFEDINKRVGKKQYLVNYFISAHPGATLEDALNLALSLIKRHIHPEQIQDYIPLPMTVSASIYYTKKDPFTGKSLYVASGLRERKLQRAFIQYRRPQNKKYIIEALRKLDKMALFNIFRREAIKGKRHEKRDTTVTDF